MTSLDTLTHRLDATVFIRADQETVFRFFTESPAWARWWGPGSTIDARPGGKVYIRHPNGIESAGEVLEVEPPARIVFTYGFVSGTPVPVGGSRVTVRVAPERGGTRLYLTHDFAEESARDEHRQGWRYQLALFANAVSDQVNRSAEQVVDRWVTLWNETDAGKRTEQLAGLVEPDIRFRDRYGNTENLTDLLAHIAAVQKFMPGFQLRRAGKVRHCQGTALADWIIVGPDGQERIRGTNVFELSANGRILSVTGVTS